MEDFGRLQIHLKTVVGDEAGTVPSHTEGETHAENPVLSLADGSQRKGRGVAAAAAAGLAAVSR